MGWNVACSVAAIAAGLLGLRVDQLDPAFDFQIATPKETPPLFLATYQPTAYPVAQAAAKANDPAVSVSFHDAHVGEVLKWMERQGVSFVVTETALKNRSVTLSLKNQPLSTAVDALADALGGHWERRGDIRVFKAGSSLFNSWSNGTVFLKPDTNLFDGKKWTMPKGQSFNLYPRWDSKSNTFQGWGKSDGDKLFGYRTWVGPINSQGISKFLKSLTPRQKELQKSQGYLKLDDLTEEQRKMIGVTNKPANFNLQYSKDGQTITIKSK